MLLAGAVVVVGSLGSIIGPRSALDDVRAELESDAVAHAAWLSSSVDTGADVASMAAAGASAGTSWAVFDPEGVGIATGEGGLPTTAEIGVVNAPRTWRRGDRIYAVRPLENGGFVVVSRLVTQAAAAAHRQTLYGCVGSFGLGAVVLVAGAVGRRELDHALIEIAELAERIEGSPIAGEDPLQEALTALGRLAVAQDELESMLHALGRGDLSRDHSGQGRLGFAIHKVVEQQRRLVGQIGTMSAELSLHAKRIQNASLTRDEGASSQSSAVEQTLRTMDGLVKASVMVSEAAKSVQDAAVSTNDSSELISERARQLDAQASRIHELLGAIRQVAKKAEVLSLNAALEGIHAGELGSGFSLVANEMQELTITISGLVRDISTLTEDITAASEATTRATEQAIDSSQASTKAAKRIGMISRQTASGTRQVSQNMEEVRLVIQHSESDSRASAETAGKVAAVAKGLAGIVSEFSMPDEDTDVFKAITPVEPTDKMTL